jgi:dTDP-4-amino-4,6-dideoxy-D-galactose acyltransferase
MSTSQSPECSLLEWDSAFFGYPIARLYDRHVDGNLLAEAFDWCHARAVRCLYYLAPAGDAPSLLAAQAAGMQFIDVRLTLARTIASEQDWASGVVVSPATDGDRIALVKLAPDLARVSRFSADPRFGKEAAARLYEIWLTSKADAVFVTHSRMSGSISGCTTCIVEPDGTGVISLMVVKPENHGRDLGLALCTAALHWFADCGCVRAQVVTQGHNVASQRVYQRAGFLTHSVEVWFHKWFEPRPDHGVEP